MKRAQKVIVIGLLVIGVFIGAFLVTGCGHEPYSPCNGTGFWGSPCGPEYPVN